MTATQPFEQVIQKGIQTAIEEIVKQEAEEASKRVEKRVRGEATQIAANLLRHFDMQVFGDKLTIAIDFKNTKL